MFEEVRLLTKVFVDWFLPNYCFSLDKPHSNEYECLCDECWTYLSPDHGKNWIDNLPIYLIYTVFIPDGISMRYYIL